MKLFLVPLLFATVAMAANVGVNLYNGGYNYNYATGDVGAHTKSETGSNGVVSGSYSYIDPNGDLRSVHYNAGPNGYQPSGDISVDRKTAEAASLLAALAPKAPAAPAPIAPVMAANVGVNLYNGGYNYNYATGDVGAHTKSETGNNGVVSGSYSYIDPNGDLRSVHYNAGPNGYQPSGDISVDRKTAEAASLLAALAPKAPEAPAPIAPVMNLTPVPSPYLFILNAAAGTAQYAANW